MNARSKFGEDLQKERKLQSLLDTYYAQYLKQYSFERVVDLDRQLAGIDLLFTHKSNGEVFSLDEKAQLDYINDDLPTFAFEVSYLKDNRLKKGWLFDQSKKTDFYALVTAIYADEPDRFTSCKVTFANRKKLLRFLSDRKLTAERLENRALPHGKIAIGELDQATEGYLYFSRANKAEKPLNLVLRLDFLIHEGIAKRFV
ncbi:hypothetical protein [Pseudozobellia thermophila]|uniref:Uncharacterized protein n=1 Tax=Pseudozobellia thermophila TaxID=192903 RepID=A0A1M6BH41_9FLAO|nr:hypothetical protein [Pseudozobellia thermophila]SHI48025.1 hypothetical protein SAMN04488513_101420 [Pseudozobellia thermophila]